MDGATLGPPKGIKVPTKATLGKWRLTVEEWVGLGDAQGWACAACGKPFSTKATRPPIIHHDHRSGIIGGLVDFTCNYYLLRVGITADRLRAVADYIDRMNA